MEVFDYFGLVVPCSALSAGARVGEVRCQMIEENLLDMVIALPLWPGDGRDAERQCATNGREPKSDEAAAILILNSARTSDRVLLVDASRDFPASASEAASIQTGNNKIVATYLRTNLRPGAETELSSPVCYAGELDLPAAGVVVDHYAYAATVEDIRRCGYNLHPSSYL